MHAFRYLRKYFSYSKCISLSLWIWPDLNMKSLLIFYLISNTIYQHVKQSSTRTRHVRLCLLFTNIFSIDIDFCFSPPVQRPRELLQSLGVRPWYVIYIRTSFPLKPLNQIKPNLTGMMLGWSDSPPFIQDGGCY